MKIRHRKEKRNAMKSIWILLLVLCPIGNVLAQEGRLRKKYINFSFSKLEAIQTGVPALKSNYGAAFTVGRTYFVHKNPLAGMVRFGIDATWFDLNYTNYTTRLAENENSYGEHETSDSHQAEIGMQVGPSITVNPVDKLNIHGYFRYAPSFSGLYNGDIFAGNYATFFVSGAAVSYAAIGLGVEARFGNSTYKELFGGDSDEDYEEESEKTSFSLKTKFTGVRFYLTFRF